MVTKKQLPVLRTDEEAEHFVATADLSEYDLSGFVVSPIRFVDAAPEPNVAVPAPLLHEVERRAKDQGLTSERFIVEAIERALREAA